MGVGRDWEGDSLLYIRIYNKVWSLGHGTESRYVIPRLGFWGNPISKFTKRAYPCAASDFGAPLGVRLRRKKSPIYGDFF